MKPKNTKKYKLPKPTKKQRVMNAVYLACALVAFETIGLMFVIFPRTTYSESEKRELKQFPELTAQSWFSGEFASDVSEWFSDTVPMRDTLTEMSVSLRELRGFRQSGIKLHGVTAPKPQESKPEPSATTTPTTTAPEPAKPDESTPQPEQTTQTTTQGNHEIDAVEQPIDADDNRTIINNGIAVVGTRALMLYGGNFSVGKEYAEVINKYKEALGDVNVYSMIIPTSCEFYSPAEVRAYCGSELDNINYVIENLRDDVRAVDVYTTLANHTKEAIYLRTDHHWAPLGAYYAAKEFAAAAGVPYLDISEYEERVVHDYVGTMYAYSEDIVIKNNPEDFVYYVPKNVEYTTTYYEYELTDGKITGAAAPETGNFFIKYKDGSSMAYCTFMGGDSKIVHVETNAGTGRSLLILKDSYGNALPGYLFGSFDNIYVVDMRYFTHNIVDYIKNNGVTDVLFANNAFHAATASTVTYYNNFLTQQDWGY